MILSSSTIQIAGDGTNLFFTGSQLSSDSVISINNSANIYLTSLNNVNITGSNVNLGSINTLISSSNNVTVNGRVLLLSASNPGGIALNSTTILGPSSVLSSTYNPSASLGFANSLTAMNICKAWAVYATSSLPTGASVINVIDSFNIKSITANGAGTLIATFINPMATNAYYFNGNCLAGIAANTTDINSMTSASINFGHVFASTNTAAFTTANLTGCFVVYGRQ